MGYLGRRIGLSQDKGDSTPGGADGAVGGGSTEIATELKAKATTGKAIALSMVFG